jgi:hypothetical protein
MTRQARRIRLTPEQERAIDDTLRALHDVSENIPAAEACGIDCTEYRQLKDELTQKLTLIKQHFGLSGVPS